MGSPLEDEISPFSVFSSPLLLPRGLVVGADPVADLVADPAPALMGGDQRALMAPDPSAHQGASAVLLLATTAPLCSDGSAPQKSEKPGPCSDGSTPSCGGTSPVCPDGSALSTTGQRPCTGGRPVCADASLSPLCADGSELGRGGRGGGRGRG